GDGYLSSDIIGLFEFRTYRFLESSDNNDASKDINELQLDNIKSTWFTTPTNAKKVINDKQKFLKKQKRKDSELFRDKLYDKPKKQRTNSSYWNEYNGQEI
ncbi:27368_t:CDS:2, partial [Racocetra persica]